MAERARLGLWNRKYVEHHKRVMDWVEGGLPKRDIGVPLHVRQIVNHGMSDYWRLWGSLAAWVRPALPPNVSIAAFVTDSPVPNAWPFRDAFGPGQHVVVVTSTTIARMQRLAYIVAQAAEAHGSRWAESPTLGAAFPPQHSRREDFDAFAQLVLQAAFVFLFNHELAHLNNGHDGCAASTSAYHWYVEKIERPKRIRRTVEFDADASAFAWTQYFYSRFNANPQTLTELGPTRARMVRACLASPESRLTITAYGALVFHLALSSHAHERDAEHPSFRERVRLSRLACRNHARVARIDPVSDVESAQLAVGLVCYDALQPEPDRILVGRDTEEAERPFFSALRDALLGDDGEDGGKNDVERHREMAGEMAQLQPVLEKRRIHSNLPRVDWWSDLLATH